MKKEWLIGILIIVTVIFFLVLPSFTLLFSPPPLTDITGTESLLTTNQTPEGLKSISTSDCLKKEDFSACLVCCSKLFGQFYDACQTNFNDDTANCDSAYNACVGGCSWWNAGPCFIQCDADISWCKYWAATNSKRCKNNAKLTADRCTARCPASSGTPPPATTNPPDMGTANPDSSGTAY